MEAYAIIIRGLQKKYPKSKYKYNLGDIKVEEINYQRITQTEFLNKILQATWNDNEGNILKILPNRITPQDLQSLMVADYLHMPILDFQCSIYAVYYFLLKCKLDGAYFNFSELEKFEKIKLKEDKKFIRNNFDQFLTRHNLNLRKLIKGEPLNIPISLRKNYHDIIDSLFR